MSPLDEQLLLAKRVCDDALAGKLDLAGFYAVAGDVTEFSGFPKIVVADVLDFIEHESNGQEWQKLDLLIDRLLLDKATDDERRIAARTSLRKNLSMSSDVAVQVDDWFARFGDEKGSMG